METSLLSKSEPIFDYGSLQVRDAEVAVLGAVLLEPESATKLFRKLNKNLFGDLHHRKIFETMQSLLLENIPIDVTTILQRLRRQGDEAVQDAGGLAYIMELQDGCPSIVSFSYFLEELKDFANRRAICREIQETVKLIGDKTQNASDVLESFHKITAKSLRQAVTARPPIRFISPMDAREYVPEEGVLLIGDNHITRGGIAVIGGPPGIGKSRAATALALSGATQRSWLGLQVHTQFKTLIIQAENAELRLAADYSDLPAELMEEFVRISLPPVTGLAFHKESFKAAVIEACEEFVPDIVVIDPWNRAARDDAQRDYQETLQNIQESLPGDQPPALVIVAHTRKPKDAEKKTGRELLHELSGSTYLGSAPRSVFVMTAATNDPEDDRIIWQNPKNNDGKMCGISAWHRRGGLFDACEGFDWDDYHKEPEGSKKITVKDLEALFESGDRLLEKKKAVEELMEQTGLGKTACYEAFKLDGKFAQHLSKQGDYLCWLKDGVEQIPDSVSAAA